MIDLLFLILDLSFFFFVFQRLKRYIHFFQQHEYDGQRFLSWIIKNRYFDRRGTILLVILFLIGLLNKYLAIGLGLVGFVILAILEPSPKKAKKPLVWTSRAKRIFIVSLLASFFLTIFLEKDLYLVFLIQLLPVLLVGSNMVLMPLEKIIQFRYLKQAKKILNQVKPKIIGLTGSYGKTTTKIILGQILNAHRACLWTPESINTLMGITRTIRQELKPEHKFFVVEMGAYGIGSIKRLCQLTPPQVGLITSIGLAHYERFKDIETTTQAKSELLSSLPADGLAVLNGDDPYCHKIAEVFKGKKLFFSINDVQNIKQTETDLEFDFKNYHIQTKLFGTHNIYNILAAFTTAMALGVPPILAQAVLQKIKPVPHRLEILRDSRGITIIDDAYNSNPIGFENALKVLKNLTARRRILVTPGMVELGKRSEEAHKKISKIIEQVCDYVVLIGKKSTKFLQENLENFYVFSSLSQAQEFLKGLIQPGDVILYENDLPDIYDDKIVF